MVGITVEYAEIDDGQCFDIEEGRCKYSWLPESRLIEEGVFLPEQIWKNFVDG